MNIHLGLARRLDLSNTTDHATAVEDGTSADETCDSTEELAKVVPDTEVGRLEG